MLVERLGSGEEAISDMLQDSILVGLGKPGADMLGDSDQDFLDLDGNKEDEQLPDSSQELQRLRMAEIRRRLTQNRKLSPPQDEDAEFVPDEDVSADLPVSSLPPYPTPHATPVSRPAEMPTAQLPRPLPLPEMRPSMDDPGMTELVSPPTLRRRRATQPFSSSPSEPSANGPPEQVSVRSGGSSLPGWRNFRHHSPWLVPLVFVMFFFLLVLANKHTLAGPMLFIFAAIGLLQAAVLLYATSDVFWLISVISGFIIMTAVTFFVFFVPLFAIILSLLLVALGVVALRERYQPVKDGTVAVMGLFQKYHRTLQPGFNLRIPGEKLLGVVETHQIRYDLRALALTLLSGEQVVLDIALMYQVVPGQEYLAVRNTGSWRLPIQEQLVAAVQDVVSTLSADDFRPYPASSASQKKASAGLMGEEHEQAPLMRVNDLLTSAMRELVADRGVAIHTVKIGLQEGPHLPGQPRSPRASPTVSHPTTILPTSWQGAGSPLENTAQRSMPATQPATQPPIAGAGAQHPAGTIPSLVLPGQLLPSAPRVTPIAPPPRGGAVPPEPAPAVVPSIISPQALAETYDAVLRRRITDLATIRRIVAQFEAVANDPKLSEQVPFDAAAGARNLLHHLYQLETQGASHLSQPPAGNAAPSESPVPEDQ